MGSRFIAKGTLTELSSFLSDHYLRDYIGEGFSKIKFVTGSAGSGKSHFLSLCADEAAMMGFKSITLSARDVPLYDFKELYSAIVSACNIDEAIERMADRKSVV